MTNVAAGLFIRQNHILIARRGKNQNLAGCWEFPGGKQEGDESILECLEREIREEFQVPCRAWEIHSHNPYHYPGGSIDLIAVRAELLSGDLVLSVHDDYRWVEIGKLSAYNLAPADVSIAEKLMEEYP